MNWNAIGMIVDPVFWSISGVLEVFQNFTFSGFSSVRISPDCCPGCRVLSDFFWSGYIFKKKLDIAQAIILNFYCTVYTYQKQ